MARTTIYKLQWLLTVHSCHRAPHSDRVTTIVLHKVGYTLCRCQSINLSIVNSQKLTPALLQ